VRVKRPRVPQREIHPIANGLFGPITEMQGSTAGELEAFAETHQIEHQRESQPWQCRSERERRRSVRSMSFAVRSVRSMSFAVRSVSFPVRSVSFY
jgi:hypothetical protein